MDCIKLEIPYNFISKKLKPTWPEMKYGIDNKLVSPNAAIEHATSELAVLDNYPEALVDLASLDFNDSIYPQIEELTKAAAKISADELKDKWLYLVLAWLYETRDDYNDPLELVEGVYADFDYPESISNFVRYMPASETDSQNEGIDQLYYNWKNYLIKQEEHYKK